jgi:hypothetical protein
MLDARSDLCADFNVYLHQRETIMNVKNTSHLLSICPMGAHTSEIDFVALLMWAEGRNIE